MSKYTKKIVERITTLIRKDSYSIKEVCQEVGISKDTFYSWMRTKPDFSDAVKNAQDDFDEKVLAECEKSLIKLIKGYTVTETKITSIASKEKTADGKPQGKIKEMITTEKHFGPNLGAIIHFQTNKDPEHWKNRHMTELTGKDGRDLFEKMTDEELDQKIKDLERKADKDRVQVHEGPGHTAESD